MVKNIRQALTQSYINTFTKVSLLTSLAVQGLGPLLSLEGEPVQSLVRVLRSQKLHDAPHQKNNICVS